MNLIRAALLVLPILACSPVLAETMKFEDAAGMLGASCAKDINESCRGVNLDSVRLKDCLARNEDRCRRSARPTTREPSALSRNESPPAPPFVKYAPVTWRSFAAELRRMTVTLSNAS